MIDNRFIFSLALPPTPMRTLFLLLAVLLSYPHHCSAQAKQGVVEEAIGPEKYTTSYPLAYTIEVSKKKLSIKPTAGVDATTFRSFGWVVVHEDKGQMLSRAIRDINKETSELDELIFQRFEGKYSIFLQAFIGKKYCRISNVVSATKKKNVIRVTK